MIIDFQLENLDDVRKSYDQESRWHIFNDSKVSFTTFESFVNMKNRFHSDTAYVLLYQKFSPPAAAPTTSAQVPLRSDLLVSAGVVLHTYSFSNIQLSHYSNNSRQNKPSTFYRRMPLARVEPVKKNLAFSLCL